MKYILEIYHQGDCIEHREQENVFIPPAINEQIYIEFENPHYSEEHGNWWIVKKRQGKRISESILGYRFSRRKIGENI